MDNRTRSIQNHLHRRESVLDALEAHPHGLTLGEIQAMTGLTAHVVEYVIEREHGYAVYVDHWKQHPETHRWLPVFALCECPDDCPRPVVRGPTSE